MFYILSLFLPTFLFIILNCTLLYCTVLYSPFNLLSRLSDKEANRVVPDLEVLGVDGDLTVLALSALLHRQQQQLELDEAELCGHGEGHGGEGGGEGLCVHLTSRALEVVILPAAHVRALQSDRSHPPLHHHHRPHHLEGPHGEEVGHHGAEARGETRLGDEAELELGQADHVVPLLPVPTGDVEEVGLQQDTQF